MSTNAEDTIGRSADRSSDHAGFPLSRRTALRGLVGTGLLALGAVGSAGTATATPSIISLVQSDTDSRITGHGYAPGGTATKDQHFAALRDDSLFTAIDAPAVVNEWWETEDPWNLKSQISAAATFIWHDPEGYIGPTETDQGGLEMIRVEETFDLSAAQLTGGLSFIFGVDNYGIVYVNGTEVATTYSQNPRSDLAQYLVAGTNHLEIRAINEGSIPSPAAIIYEVMGPERPTTIALDIDVKPGNGDEVDPINPTARGDIPVAVYSTADIDATTLDVSTLRFGSATAVDAGAGVSASHGGHPEDVDGDGLLDLVLHFPTSGTGFEPGDQAAKLVGETADGDAVVGVDAVRTVGGRGRGRGR